VILPEFADLRQVAPNFLFFSPTCGRRKSSQPYTNLRRNLAMELSQVVILADLRLPEVGKIKNDSPGVGSCCKSRFWLTCGCRKLEKIKNDSPGVRDHVAAKTPSPPRAHVLKVHSGSPVRFGQALLGFLITAHHL